MYTLIAIFYVSLIAIIVMVLLKRHEVKTSKPCIISRLSRGSDHFFHSIFANIRKSSSYVNRHTFVALAHWIAVHVLVRIRNVYVEIKSSFLANPHGKKIMDAVRGRGEISDHGASFYLRRISEK
ncbi:MAG: hypothetical protein AAB470_02625 [Patescibacteria group bacterium]